MLRIACGVVAGLPGQADSPGRSVSVGRAHRWRGAALGEGRPGLGREGRL